MAWAFRGNTASMATSEAKKLPMVISSFTLANKAAAGIVANVYMISGVNLYHIAPANLSLGVSEMYQGDNQIVMLATEQIRVQTSGSTDFNFFIDNM